jgi:Na+/H+ antiporter NhaD/arsenite permease-like protein
LLHSAYEYLSFVALLVALFTVAGGIILRGDIVPHPRNNTLLLALGAVLANLIGTTGASMLLIRPLLKSNRLRRHTFHLPLFFIFLVSNAGGLLTPMGDPPLFLGYLQGVPFLWTLRLFPVWALMIGALLLIFYLWDRRAFSKEESPQSRKDPTPGAGLSLAGSGNFLLLGGVLGAALLSSPWRELLMLAITALSLAATKREIRSENDFSFHPVVEVAVLFAGIFITMTPALILLGEKGASLGLSRPAHFFWASGLLSSFLDNAPTYLTFFSVAQGMGGAGPQVAGVSVPLLKAISCGSVLMGANSYVGNGPNFMVKAIADEADFKTPSFFGYIGYACLILFPLYLAVTWIFF